MTWGDTIFAVFDVETTGFDRRGADRIVEAAAIRFRLSPAYEELGRFSSLANPGRPIPEKVTAIHGIDDAAVANAPPVDAVVVELIGFMCGDVRENVVLVAHNAPFDLEFAEAQAHRSEVKWARPPAICTCGLARALYPSLPNHKLVTVFEHVRKGRGRESAEQRKFHRASVDVEATVIAAVNMLRHPRVTGREWLRQQKGVWWP